MLAKVLARRSNECCYRTDGWEEAIEIYFQEALKHVARLAIQSESPCSRVRDEAKRGLAEVGIDLSSLWEE